MLSHEFQCVTEGRHFWFRPTDKINVYSLCYIYTCNSVDSEESADATRDLSHNIDLSALILADQFQTFVTLQNKKEF